MANTVIALKKSATPSAAPIDLANGEIAINYADGVIFYKASNGAIASISSGSASFGTVNAAGTLLLADAVNDVLDIRSGNNIEISGDAINDRMTITANLAPAYDRANAAWTLANTANGKDFSVTISDTAPSSPTAGKLWYNSNTGGLFIYYTDVDSSQWVEATTSSAYNNPSYDTANGAFVKANNALANSSGTFDGNLTVAGNTTVNGTAPNYAPNRPGFRVYGSGTTNNLTTTQNGTGCLTSNNWTVSFNQGSYLANTNGIFTAPVTGLYQVCVIGRNSGYSSGISQIGVTKNGSSGGTVGGECILMVEWAASSSMNHAGGSTIINLTAGDTLACKILAGEINFDGNDNWSVAYIG